MDELFHTLVDNLPELAWTALPDGHVDFYNRRWYEYTGTTFEQMQGWGWQSVHDPAMLDAVLERWRRSLESGEPFEMEFPLRGSDGVFRWFLTRVRPLRGDEGQILRWMGVNTNIDEQRRTRARLQETSLELEHLRDESFRDVFLGILGHDLRNPLSAVHMSIAGILRRSALDPQNTKVLRRALGSCDRMALMISQLLDMTRARNPGGIPMDCKQEDLSSIVGRVIDKLRAAHPGRTIESSTSGETRGRADRGRLDQVLCNVIGNAIAYSPIDSAVRVRLCGGPEQLEIGVHNDGAIPPDVLPRLFDPFRRGTTISKEIATQGLGLGLYISQEIVRAHGGTIAVTSTADEGTTFVIHLPVGGERQVAP